MTDIDAMLEERGKRYGEFAEHARISQALKEVMAATPRWAELSPDKKEALEMNAHKVARILNGDPNWPDSWDDIAGYVTLVANRLRAAAAKRRGAIEQTMRTFGGDAHF